MRLTMVTGGGSAAKNVKFEVLNSNLERHGRELLSARTFFPGHAPSHLPFSIVVRAKC